MPVGFHETPQAVSSREHHKAPSASNFWGANPELVHLVNGGRKRCSGPTSRQLRRMKRKPE